MGDLDDNDKHAMRLAQLLQNYMYNPTYKLNPQNITVGCEIECVLAYHRREGGPAPAPKEEHGKTVIRQALAKPIAVKCAQPNCQTAHTFQLPLTNQEFDFNFWQVTHDNSVAMELNKLQSLGEAIHDYEFYPIEIKSRILRPSDMQKTLEEGHEVDFQSEITAVMDKLNSDFHILGDGSGHPEYHLFVTPNCGFHVHIGNGHLPIPFATVKKVYSTFIACERQIDGFHGINRITGSDLKTQMLNVLKTGTPHTPIDLIDPETHNKPLSHFFLAKACAHKQGDSQHSPQSSKDPVWWTVDERLKEFQNGQDRNAGDIQLDMDSWLNMVQPAKSVNEIRLLQSKNDDQCNINLSNLPTPETPTSKYPFKKNTIEFRQHAGTLNPTAALSFIDILINLVIRCERLNDEDFLALIRPGGQLRHPNLSSLDICRFVGCSQKAFDYYQRQLNSQDSELSIYLADQAAAAEKAIARKYPIANVALEMTKWQQGNIDQAGVQKRIMHKHLAGGYGQFSKNYLAACLPDSISADHRRLITIGYPNPNKMLELDPLASQAAEIEKQRSQKQ